MKAALPFALVLLAATIARADTFIPAENVDVLEEPAGLRKNLQLEKGRTYELVRRDESVKWCKVALGGLTGWVECSAGRVGPPEKPRVPSAPKAAPAKAGGK